MRGGGLYIYSSYSSLEYVPADFSTVAGLLDFYANPAVAETGLGRIQGMLLASKS